MPSLKTNIVRIGNSEGIRIPKAILQQCHLQGEVELEPQNGCLIVKSTGKARAGWEEAFQVMAERGDDKMLDEDVITETSWDRTEWEW